jgi:hypothetical protein
MAVASTLWTRLDMPGHDACRLIERPAGWDIQGTAVFAHGGTPACLEYAVACDASWRSKWGRVRGWIGPRAVDLHVVRTPDGAWTLNGEEVLPAMDCIDLDFGFTPATNILPIRRLDLAIGHRATIFSAWLDAPAGRLEVLEQTYRRSSAGAYAYEAPRFAFNAQLEVDRTGFVRRYPTLWDAVSDE